MRREQDKEAGPGEPPGVAVIIRTAAEARRADQLQAAITSVLSQGGVRAVPIVVVNGPRVDAGVLAALERRRHIRLLRIAGGLLDTYPAGIGAVREPFFCFLDDDDLYLPDGLRQRLEPMLADPTIDLCVANGVDVVDGRAVPSISGLDAIAADPLAALLETNWMVSCAGCFRSTVFPPAWFAGVPDYEWTWIAFKACAEGRRIRFLDRAVFRSDRDTPGSMSKQDLFIRRQEELYAKLLALPLRPDIHQRLRRRHGAALHHIAELDLRDGAIGEAWRRHLHSLLRPGGWRYLPFTRRLLRLAPPTRPGNEPGRVLRG